MVKHEALKNHLETLRNSIPELRGVLLASTEGLPVAHSLSNGTDPNRVAAMAAATSSLWRRIQLKAWRPVDFPGSEHPG